MENKYFTPDIEDIRVGYELQYHNWSMDEAGVKELNFNKWETTILTEGNVKTFMEYGIRGGVRVPYLTKEQIEAEGWEPDVIQFKKEIDSDSYYSLTLADRDITISKVYMNGWSWVWKPFYSGECKDINTFRTICKLLKINK